MSHFTSLTEHQQLVFWAELLAILAVARLLGTLLRRWGQPAVVGELAAGVLLGPSVLGRVWPGGFTWLFPADKVQSGAVNAIGWLGIAFLLVLTGFETDLDIVRSLGRAAGSVATGALVLPFLCGLAIGLTVPSVFMGTHAHRAVFTLFMAVGLSISSLPVIAKVLTDLDFMRRNFGQVTVAVGMVNDLVGWLALGVIAGLASSQGLSAWRLAVTIGAMAALLVGGLSAGQQGVDGLLRWVRTRSDGVGDSLVVSVLVVVLVATLAQAAGIEAVLGAYIAGIVLGRSRFRHPQLHEHLESITYGVLAPVFFATAGLKLDLGTLARSTTALWGGIVFVVAVAAKFVGSYGGARAGRLPRREALALGSALNARGAVEVVIATVGLSLGILSRTAFTAIVLMAIVTSIMAPPLLRWVVKDWPGTEEEQRRLQHEGLLERNLLVRSGRLLLPSRGRPNSIAAAQILHAAWPSEVGVTVLSVSGEDEEPDLESIADVLEDREVEFRRVTDEGAFESLLREARLGYAAIGVGAADAAGDRLLSPVVDDLLAESPIPLVIVKQGMRHGPVPPPALSRALVPVSGSPSSRTAQEIAFSMSAHQGTEVILMHVINRPEVVAAAVRAPAGPRAGDADGAATAATGLRPGTADAGSQRGVKAADAVLDDAVTLGRQFDVLARTHSRPGTSTGEEILAAAEEVDADLIVLGATVRRLDGRPFLGHNVEHILEQANVTVVVVTTPDVTADHEGTAAP
jgi:Kef-type K+ transport system membrane component KefB/nucleotide-binding universal stress UspA family protein